MNTVKVQLAKDGGFHDSINHVDATVAKHWAEQGICQIVDDKSAKPEPPTPAPAEEVRAPQSRNPKGKG